MKAHEKELSAAKIRDAVRSWARRATESRSGVILDIDGAECPVTLSKLALGLSLVKLETPWGNRYFEIRVVEKVL